MSTSDDQAQKSLEQSSTGELQADGVEQAALRSHTANLLARGQALIPVLRALAEELPSHFQRRRLGRVIRVLERNDFGEALTALVTVPEYWIPLLHATSTSQDPGRVLHEFLDDSRRAAALRWQKWQAFAYPLCILGMAAAVLTLLSFLVIPMFRQMMSELAIQVPAMTGWVFEIASWITSGRILVAFVLLAIVGLVAAQASRFLPSSWRVWFGDHFGTPLGRAAALARFAQFTADLLETGMEIPSALRIAGHATRNARLMRASCRLAHDIERNETHASSCRSDPLSQTVAQALRGDMPVAARVRLLRELSHCYAERAQARLSWTQGIVEPVAIAVVGASVGGVVIALFLPLISLIQVLSS